MLGGGGGDRNICMCVGVGRLKFLYECGFFFFFFFFWGGEIDVFVWRLICLYVCVWRLMDLYVLWMEINVFVFVCVRGD